MPQKELYTRLTKKLIEIHDKNNFPSGISGPKSFKRDEYPEFYGMCAGSDVIVVIQNEDNLRTFLLSSKNASVNFPDSYFLITEVNNYVSK